MAASGQTINDRLNAVRYALVGQGLARTVCKATTLEVLGPKKKHIDYLLACTNEPNVSTPQLANLLIERTQHTNWAVVFKALISIHHLMSYGNERFTQYLATSNHSFELADFMDRTTPQGYNMSAFVRRYAKYINDKSVSYRTLAIDLCKIRSGNDNALRTMNMDNLSKTLPIVQAQFDSLLEFDAEAKDLNNGVIMAAFRLLYKDLVKLYVAYQEAIINLLERYFKLSRKKTREALELYKKYLARMDKVAGFLQVVDAVELDKSEMPDLTNSPASILKLLEEHLAQLDAKKRGATPASPENQVEEEVTTEATSGDAIKENEPPAKAETEAEVGSKKTTTKVEPQSQQAKQTSELSERKPPVSTEPEKPAPPQKPARPSPKASPKVSPATQKPAPKVAACVGTSSPAPPPPPPAPASAEKKGPPERPVKPPSRPPPPSSSGGPPAVPAPVASSSSSSTPTTCAPESVAGREEPSASTQAKVASPTPPPHPPPPHASAPSPVSVAEPENSDRPATPVAVPEANQRVASSTATNGRAAEPNESPAPTCSAASNLQEAAVASDETNHNDAIGTSEMNEQETNHVNNGTSQVVAAEEEEIVPPPPIDDNEFDNIPQEPPAGEEPVVNGQ